MVWLTQFRTKTKKSIRYKSLNPEEKGKLCLAEQNGIKHWILQAKIRLHYNSKLINSVQHDLDHRIPAFQSKIREGSYYICSICNRILCRKTVTQLNKRIYHNQQELFTELYTHDSFLSWNDLSPVAWWQPFLT